MSLFRKRRGVVLGLIVAVAITAGAIAYWTAGGSGTGTATTRAGTDALTVNQTSTISNMYPGDSAQTLSGNFDNPNPGPVYVGTVTASIDSVTKASGAPAGTCDATDYTLSGAAMTVNAEVPAGTGKGSWTGATIKFNDKAGTNQNACQGATVNLAYAIS
jgi:hypothetical protein